MKPSLIAVTLSLGLLSCAEDPSGKAPVPVTISVTAQADSREFVRDDGWQLHIDQARLLVGPLYLRAPKREAQSSLQRLFFPKAWAHGTHAQTLREGQVIGELLEQTAVDALNDSASVLDTILVEAERLDRLSVVLDEPRDPSQAKQTRGYHAWIEGSAKLGEKEVPFACGLTIAGDADERPENLEARRRVDQIGVQGAPQLNGPAKLTLAVDVRRWLEFVDFSSMEAQANPCEDPQSPMLSQWYLGIRRPEAFAATLEKGK